MVKRARTHADTFKDLEDIAPVDFDPEEDGRPVNDSDVSEDESVDEGNGRAHYQPVGKSKLRAADPASLGPQYSGSRVSRKGALGEDDEHDPFAGSDSDGGSVADGMASSGSDQGSNAADDDEDLFDQDGDENTEEGGDSDEDMDASSGDEGDLHQKREAEKAQLRKIVVETQGNMAASIAQASKVDADKGKAVKQQRKAFDSLLNCRIRLQPSLVATNSIAGSQAEDKSAATGSEAMQAAEQAALTLWNTLDGLRSSLDEARSGKKRKRLNASAATPVARLWSHMQDSEAINLPHRRSVLLKWSAKTQAASAQPVSRRLTEPARQNTIVEVLNDQLSNTERLVKRTRMPRSCAPVQASKGIVESPDIYDDADFYGVLLKELLEQRSIDSAASVQVDVVAQQYQAAREAKTRKNVDTKASKGRKMRYTVHEKLQNFMAPEDRGSWGERQIDELFGSLLGKRLALGETEVDGGADEGDMAEEEALMMFRN